MKSIVLCDNGKPDKVLPLCEKHNFGIEMQAFFDTNDMESTEARIASYKGILPKNIEKYLHAPCWDLCLGSANKKIVEVTRFYFDYAYDIAEKLGCSGIVVHHGYVPNTSHPPAWIKRAVAFWQDFFVSHPGNVKMFMENLTERTADMFPEIVDICQTERLAVNLDIGHAHFSGLPVLDWIKQFNRRIKYVHLHQNGGTSDEHLGLRKGTMKIVDVLNALEEHAPEAVWALECSLDDMEDSIALLSEYGFME